MSLADLFTPEQLDAYADEAIKAMLSVAGVMAIYIVATFIVVGMLS